MAMIVNENFRAFVPANRWDNYNRAQFFSFTADESDDSGEKFFIKLGTKQYMPSYKSDLIIYPPNRVQDEYLPLNDNTRLPFSHWKSGLGNEQEFYPFIISKGKVCRGMGLSGTEKRACKKQIKSSCGNKPIFGRARKDEWTKCASSASISDSQITDAGKQEQEPATKTLSNNAKAGIAIGAIAGIGLLMWAVIAMTKPKVQPNFIGR